MDLNFRAMGFSNIKTLVQMNHYIKIILAEFDRQYVLGRSDCETYVEYCKKFGNNFGLAAQGLINEDDKIVITSCMPHCFSQSHIHCRALQVVQRGKSGQKYVATGEEEKTGNSFVFQLQNQREYTEHDKMLPAGLRVNIYGLCSSGTVILPIAKDAEALACHEEEERLHNGLVQQAQAGDKNAEKLLLEHDERVRERIRERLEEEDVLSVVEGFLLPVTNKETVYSILGDILTVEKQQNTATKEMVYSLTLHTVGTNLTVFINEEDVMGLPMEGMRFMGICQLQGRIIYGK